MHTVTVEEAKAHFSELLDEARQGVEIVITDDQKPVAKLAPAERIAKVDRGFGVWKDKIVFHKGWDEPLEEMQPYME
jgi:prevent-host-death family protein